MPRAKPPAGSRVIHRGNAPAWWLPLLAPARTFAADTGDVADLMGRTPAAARNGGCSWAAGPLGRCLSFDGSTGHLTTGLKVQDVGAAATGTLTFRARHAGTAGDGVLAFPFDQSNDASDGVPALTLQKYIDNNIYFGWYNGVTDYRVIVAASAANWPGGVWTHYALTWAVGAATRLYVNGVLAGTSADTLDAFAPPARTLLVGKSETGGRYNGSLDDIRIYAVALTAAEVARDVADPWWRLRRTTRWAARTVPPPGVQTIAPAAIASAESFGTATLTGLATLAPAAIASAESFGSSTVTAAATLAPAAIASAESFGVATLDLQLVVNVSLSAALLADDVSNPFDGIDPGYTVESTG